MTSTYVAGDLATLVTGEGVVVSTPDRLAEVALLLDRDLEAPTIVEVLSRGDLRALPEFAAVRVDGAEARILVRGGLVVRVDGFSVDGRDATMWTEASATLAPGAVVEVVPLGTPAVGPVLPLTAGVVRSAGVTWRPVVRPTSAPTPASAPVAVAAAPRAPAPPAAALPMSPASDYTVVRGSRATPPTPPSPPAPPPPSAPLPATPPPSAPPPGWQAPVADLLPESAEHDGRTITPAQLQALRAATAAPPAAPPPVVPERPAVALALSTGRTVPVRRRVLIGRSPRIQQVGGSQNLPALVTLDDPYVSSTHLEVSADGTRVTVTDRSTNGTLLTRQGRVPVPLDRGVATEVAIGDVLTLSKGLTATVVPAPEEV
ncbi:FHA domain-containing protein [Nocardioides carbamazepini]|uniref:FHA domain-containing protein n=1 Tax=Nocardioides carbamazepini TaxID=2854259 RepID=UPI00214A7830|nr:FHA domain-containing protein [Nocardioides carbamazepini]MCR1785784.1 FHA domain-containing protein [Nocardioides carbamazepini]